MKKLVLCVWMLVGCLLWTAPAVLAKLPAPLVMSQASGNQDTSFDNFVQGMSKQEGLFTLYRQRSSGKTYLELKPEQLNRNYLGTLTLEAGIGERNLYSGIPLNDFLFYFQRANNKLQFVVANVNFRTRPGDPQQRSLDRSFSDSVLYAVDIKAYHAQRQSLLIDLGDILLQDLPGLSYFLKDSLGSSYRMDANKSYFENSSAYPQNIEVSSVYGFSLNDSDIPYLETLPDSRSLNVKVHYSLSQLPDKNSYQPRLADDRVGYFLTAYQDFSDVNRGDTFVRYINRWQLEKQDPNAPLSPPKEPIVFWIENTVPTQYRDAIRQGVLAWNKAFEKAGFKDALQVKQMPDNAPWKPGDVRYNTIRWINTLDGYFARGPSRVNPLTGQILDADIIVDANMLLAIRQKHRTLIDPIQNAQTGLFAFAGSCGEAPETKAPNHRLTALMQDHDLCYGMEATNQGMIGSIAMSLFQNVLPSSDKMKDYVQQYLVNLIAHEVGHTLGLRHNFHGSTFLKPEELNNPEITSRQGLVSSVMDYAPVNLAPPGVKQGDYFSTVVGPYDEWAIEYGYKPSGAIHPLAERGFLAEIASRAPQPELAYATDEDIGDINPQVNRWDLSQDVLQYSQWQMDNAKAIWQRLTRRYPLRGDSYSEVREMFETVLGYYFSHAQFVARYIGGQSFSRNHANDPQGRLPFTTIPIEKQRQALTTLQTYVFSDKAFDFSPELLNQLAPSRWRHWGNPVLTSRLDFPIHEVILSRQRWILQSLLSVNRLNQLRDLELKTPQGQALTLPELFETLQQGIWTEVMPNQELGNISSLRRSLQREYLETMLKMVLRSTPVPEDARTLAWYELRQLRQSLDRALRHQDRLDTYSKAHLLESRDRITKALDAQLQSG